MKSDYFNLIESKLNGKKKKLVKYKHKKIGGVRTSSPSLSFYLSEAVSSYLSLQLLPFLLQRPLCPSSPHYRFASSASFPCLSSSSFRFASYFLCLSPLPLRLLLPLPLSPPPRLLLPLPLLFLLPFASSFLCLSSCAISVSNCS